MKRLPGPMTLLSALLVSGCSPVSAVATQPAPSPAKVVRVTKAADAEPNLRLLQNKLKNAQRQAVTIVQLGDSHTAADLLTGELRTRFQQDYGNGGIGFIAGSPVPGTRYDQVRITAAKSQWSLISARNQHSDRFPLGGYLSMPLTAGAHVHLEPTPPTDMRYRVSTLYQAGSNNRVQAHDAYTQAARSLPMTNGQWRLSPAMDNLALPLDLTFASSQNLAVGGWNILGQSNSGVVFSTLGINGAQLSVVDKWQPGWLDTLKALKPDLLILSYGTNEAFDDDLDVGLYESQHNQRIVQLRQALPGTVLLIIGAPDSIKNKGASSCQARLPRSLHPVMEAQQRVAQQNRTLYWSWQKFMGGDCSIVNWQAQDMARPDLVHFSKEGYIKVADGLYDYLNGLIAPSKH
ncbi:lipoprotein [Pseudomonas sp. M47T1]|uniref:SGNH/GDSL hydrolase family protein n=1 Tax=unclassified Pseudomonas TaxID=196821 RepID=UPI000260734E|nr:SGNH/GDSL hydrolase family protein [Pseudomonas sp. M47T1]EIK94155.1 lipoprotein [Pseudomonas sp. M47T1]